MAVFKGTKREFKRYIGPFLRNIVQQVTRKHKLLIGKCQHCGKIENLEAAHVNGRERTMIIDLILNAYGMDDSHIYEVDLNNFESQFKGEHSVVDKTILILCKRCHIEYDSQISMFEKKFSDPHKNLTTQIKGPNSGSRIYTNKEIQRKLSDNLKAQSEQGLEKFLDKYYSKEVFNLDFPLLIKARRNLSPFEKKTVVKDSKGVNRWTWKFEFQKGNYCYAISTQWYPRHDIWVKNWLENFSFKKY